MAMTACGREGGARPVQMANVRRGREGREKAEALASQVRDQRDSTIPRSRQGNDARTKSS